MGDTSINSSFKESLPPPTGATESSSLEKMTVGGQQLKVRQTETIKRGEFQDELTVASSNVKKNEEIPADGGSPILPLPGPYNPGKANIGHWFSSFLTALTVNLVAVAMTNKEIHKIEGLNVVRQLGAIWEWAQSIGALIMAKAEKEAAMHMAQAIAAVASLAVAVLGAAMQIGGKAKEATAKGKLDEMGTANPLDSLSKSSTNKATAGSRPIGPDRPVADAPAAPPTNRVFNSKKANQAPAGATTDKPNAVASKKLALENEIRSGESMSIAGHALAMSTQSVHSIFDNIIQMIFKPEIAAYEQSIELARGSKEIAGKSLDSAINQFQGATSDLDAVLRALDKASSESMKANAIQRAGA